MEINFKEVLKYAELAKFAYESDSAILSKFGSETYIKTLPDLDIKFFVSTDHPNKTHWIAVRGTANFKNVKLDADYLKRWSSQCGVYIHDGFLTSARGVYNALFLKLNEGYELRFAGHSLGGAIVAILMMMYSNNTRFKVGKSFTYGQPKVTNRKGMKKYRDLPLIRVVHDEDPVHFCPPFTLVSFFDFGVYRSFGRKLLIRDDGSYEFLSEKKSEGIRLNSFWLHLPEEEVKEHFMDNYLTALNNIK